jgi:predicted Zn-dependent protease
LDKVNVFEPNNAFTLRSLADFKMMLEDCRRALEDLDKADILEPNNAFTLRSFANVKMMLDDCQKAWRTLTRLMFLN